MGAVMERKNCVTNFLGSTYNVTHIEDYMVDIQYGNKDWGIIPALRELIANMLDTKAEYNLHWENGVGEISDKGTGLPRKAFIIGASSKASNDQVIGQFGEGLKLALITCLREDRRVSIATMGYGAEVCRHYSKAYDTEVMRLMFTDNTLEEGTTIHIECTKEEFDSAIDLFLQLKEGYTKIENNIFLPSGFICLMGLKTEENPSLLFSYDLTDKSVTNRDRNAVKTKILKQGMEKILNNIKNQKTVKYYLDGLETNPDADEYKIALNPKNKDTWLTTIQKMYGEKVAYSTNIENDIKATSNGYKVIRSQSKGVSKTLANVGIVSSKEASKGVKATQAMLVEEKEKKITYPIAKNYVQEWTVIESGREFLANAIDVSSNQAQIEYKDGYCIITDNGVGITRQNFVLGNSQKQTSQIGLFGEGFKLAALVVAREERDPKIETVGYTYYPKIEDSTEFGTELFVIEYEPNKCKQGTKTSFKASKEEVEQIKALFLQFTQSNYEMISSDTVDLIVNDSNSIYVNGLCATTMETLFSYNIKDKKIVNSRDRNSVDGDKLSYYVAQTLNDLTNKEAIKKLLIGWEKSVYQLEYKQVLQPSYLYIWKEVVEEEFKNYCIASYDYPENNAIAKRGGYHILNAIPPYIKEIFTRCGVKSADDLAMDYAKTGVHLGDSIVYPITSEYVDSWNSTHAIKELISNALDTDTEVTTDFKNGNIIIKDKGLGFKRKSLLLGSSSKEGQSNKIGSFGEGLKLSALVLTREERNFTIETVGFTITSKVEYDQEFDAELLVFYLATNNVTEGTTITFKGTNIELQNAKDDFLALSDRFTKVSEDIYTPGGCVLVNGVVVKNVKSLYSYNLPKTVITSRDRNSIDEYTLSYEVMQRINNITKKDVMLEMVKHLQKFQTTLEHTIGNKFTIRKNRKKWLDVTQSHLQKACLPSQINTQDNTIATNAGYNLLYSTSDVFTEFLKSIGFPNATQVVNALGDDGIVEGVIDASELASSASLNWVLALRIISEEFGESYLENMVLCTNLNHSHNNTQKGYYSEKTNKCYILKSMVEHSNLATILGEMVWLVAAREADRKPNTPAFEHYLAKIAGRLLERVYN